MKLSNVAVGLLLSSAALTVTGCSGTQSEIDNGAAGGGAPSTPRGGTGDDSSSAGSGAIAGAGGSALAGAGAGGGAVGSTTGGEGGEGASMSTAGSSSMGGEVSEAGQTSTGGAGGTGTTGGDKLNGPCDEKGQCKNGMKPELWKPLVGDQYVCTCEIRCSYPEPMCPTGTTCGAVSDGPTGSLYCEDLGGPFP
jgi:hypothetical protein